MKVHKIVLLIAIMLPSLAIAEIGLGSMQSVKSAEIYPGETTQFKILLFNTHSTVRVEFRYELPDKWKINIDPISIDIPSESNEYVVLNGEYVMASPIYINITAPNDVGSGKYDIKVIAHTVPINGETLSVSQERDFLFEVNVLDNVASDSDYTEKYENNITMDEIIINETVTETIIPEYNQGASPEEHTDMIAGNSIEFGWLIVIIVIIILVIFYIKY